MKFMAVFFLLLAALPSLAQVSPLPAPITTDPPEDKTAPAAMEQLVLPSHGANLNGLIYLAEGVGPHPVVILLHGFPGYEQNLDLAQAIRRAGWDVLFFHYRGSWGSQGKFSFANSIEDTQSAIDWVRNPDNAKKHRMDPARIVLIGHSMGGFMAAAGGANDAKVMAVGMLAAWNIGADAKYSAKNPDARKKRLGDEIQPLTGCTADSLFAEMTAHADDYDYNHFVPKLKDRPVLVISTNDALRPLNELFVDTMKKAGAQRASYEHVSTDHGFNDHRIALEVLVLNWLEGLNK